MGRKNGDQLKKPVLSEARNDPSSPFTGVNSPKDECVECLCYLKRKSVMMIFDQYTNLETSLKIGFFRSRGYYVSTVGLIEATIAKYVREQKKLD